MAAPAKSFLVTGSPGVGKSALIAKIVETLKASNPNLKIQGFFIRNSFSPVIKFRVLFQLLFYPLIKYE
ncbi:putative nucleoside-triphosphatase, THEP1 type, P-loop containing nucleoside triphosphate hydrolase [Helianthus anomalus]